MSVAERIRCTVQIDAVELALGTGRNRDATFVDVQRIEQVRLEHFDTRLAIPRVGLEEHDRGIQRGRRSSRDRETPDADRAACVAPSGVWRAPN